MDFRTSLVRATDGSNMFSMSLHAFQPYLSGIKPAIIILNTCYGTLIQDLMAKYILIMVECDNFEIAGAQRGVSLLIESVLGDECNDYTSIDTTRIERILIKRANVSFVLNGSDYCMRYSNIFLQCIVFLLPPPTRCKLACSMLLSIT